MPFVKSRRHSQAVRQKSAKLPFSSSILDVAFQNSRMLQQSGVLLIHFSLFTILSFFSFNRKRIRKK